MVTHGEAIWEPRFKTTIGQSSHSTRSWIAYYLQRIINELIGALYQLRDGWKALDAVTLEQRLFTGLPSPQLARHE